LGWTPPSKLALLISMLVMVVGILLGTIGFLDILGILPEGFSQFVSGYNQILVWLSWVMCVLSWVITFIAVKIKDF